MKVVNKMANLTIGLIAFATVLLIPAHALQLIGQQQINESLTLNQPKLISITLYNDANSTYTSSVNLTGNVTQVATLLNTSVSIAPFDLATLYLNASTSEEGVWTGSVDLTDLTIPVTLYAQKFHSTGWYKVGDSISVQPGDYKINIQNVSEQKAFIVVTQHGYVLQGKFYSIGETFSSDGFSFKVLDAYQNLVKLEILSDYLQTTVTVSHSSEGTGTAGGSFSFYTTQYANTIESGSEIKEHFILRNGLSTPVQLKKIEYSGTVITDKGRQPINAIQYELGTLQPGEETTFVVDINTKGLSPGVWTPIMTVKGLTQDNQIVSASISFVLTVTKAVAPSTQANITIEYPEEVVADEPFNITISGLTSGMTVDMEPNPHLIGMNVSQKEGKWTWTGKIDVNQSLPATIYVKLLGGVFKTFKFNLTVPKPPEPIIINSPEVVWVGDPFSVLTNPPTTIDINGTEYQTPANVTLLLPGKYLVKASKEGYKSSEKWIEVISPVTANVSGKTVGEQTKICFSKAGSYSVLYNNEVIASTTTDSLTFTPKEEGIYVVKDSLGHEITTFEVKKSGFSFKLPKFNEDYLILILVVILVVLVIMALRKKKPSKAKNITIQGSSTPLTLEPEG